MALTLISIETEAQVLLNDSAGSLFTAAKLDPFIAIAWRELQTRLTACGRLPQVKAIAAPLTIPAGTLTYNPTPADMLEPVKMEERAVGSTEDFTPMIEKEWETDTAHKKSILEVWAWRLDRATGIQFRGATTDRSVRLYYTTITDISANLISDLHTKTFLSARAAALASQFMGENSSRANALNEIAGLAIEDIVRIQVSHLQGLSFKRKPFNYKNSLRRRY